MKNILGLKQSCTPALHNNIAQAQDITLDYLLPVGGEFLFQSLQGP